MDLEDLFKHKQYKKHSHHHHDDHDHDDRHRRHDHSDDHAYRQGDSYSHGGHHSNHDKLEMYRSVLKTLPHKKALLTAVIGIGCLVLIIGIAVLWATFPLIIKMVEYVEVNGIKGIMDSVLPYAQKLWEGSGK